MTYQPKTKTSLMRIGIQAAVWSGVIASGIGWALVAFFGLFLFSDHYPALAGLGKVGFGLAFLFFPVFVPVSGLLSLLAILFILTKRSSLTLRSFAASFGVALLLLALVSAAVNLFFMMREQEQSTKARLEEASLSHFRASVFKVHDIIVEQRGDIISIQPVLSGTLAGKYRATVSIADSGVLMSEVRETSLPSDAHEPVFVIPLSSVRVGFRRVRMQGSQQEVIVGPMQYQIKVDLILLSSAEINDLDRMLPAVSPTRVSSTQKSVILDLGRF